MLRRIPLIGLAALLLTEPAFAQDDGGASTVGLDTLFVLVSAFLVFLMQAGFGMLEAGFIRAKNTCNILTKNFLDYCMASLGFFVFGYAIMFSEGNPFFGTSGFFLVGAESAADVPLWAFWLFQAAFCGAAATIVAGGMAERMKFPAYLAYSFIISAFIYPVVGHWTWGGGWLAQLDFFDFAGSTVVHLTGGATALVGAMILGPRLGRFNADGSSNPIPGHSVPLASLGVFILWFGWFGFNPGSNLAVGDGDGHLADRHQHEPPRRRRGGDHDLHLLDPVRKARPVLHHERGARRPGLDHGALRGGEPGGSDLDRRDRRVRDRPRRGTPADHQGGRPVRRLPGARPLRHLGDPDRRVMGAGNRSDSPGRASSTAAASSSSGSRRSAPSPPASSSSSPWASCSSPSRRCSASGWTGWKRSGVST